jgi:hypothetical protein
MQSMQSRPLNCRRWAILAWACFACSLVQPSAAGADKDDLTEAEEFAVKLAFRRLPDLRTLDVSEVQKRAAEAAKNGPLVNLGPKVDQWRSVPRVGYCVYASLFMMGEHYYNGKLIRVDDDDLLGFSTPHMKAALTKKYGKPEPGPKFEWMKVRCREEIEERCHWNIRAAVMHEGKPMEIQVACELTFRKNNTLIISLTDVERAESVRKALAGR